MNCSGATENQVHLETAHKTENNGGIEGSTGARTEGIDDDGSNEEDDKTVDFRSHLKEAKTHDGGVEDSCADKLSTEG